MTELESTHPHVDNERGEGESSSSNEPDETVQEKPKKAQSEVDASNDSVESPASNIPSITEEDIQKAREELQRNLQEEQMLTSLQMQLLVQLDKLKASIAAAESEERMANLALQQAQVLRLLQKTQNPDGNLDEETITIKLRS